MGSNAKNKQKCYCAFCRTPHRVYKKKGVSFVYIFFSLLLTVSFMWGLWGTWNQKAIPVFFICLFLGEIVTHFRWRLALICRQCGFDPLIYRKNPHRAAQKVKEFLDRRKNDPRFLLAPALDLPKKRIPRNDDFIGSSRPTPSRPL